MTLNKMGNSSSVPGTGWEGFAMPEMGHLFVAELHYDGEDGLRFGAWYQNDSTQSWYDVGDTKVEAALLNPPGGNTEVPEPGTLGVFLFGASGIGYIRRRKRKTD